MRSPTPFTIEERWTNHKACLTLRGELDLSTIDILRARLCQLRQSGTDVYIDLSELEFMDATGVNVLVRAIGDARQHPWHVSMSSELSPQVRRLFALVKMERLVA